MKYQIPRVGDKIILWVEGDGDNISWGDKNSYGPRGNKKEFDILEVKLLDETTYGKPYENFITTFSIVFKVPKRTMWSYNHKINDNATVASYVLHFTQRFVTRHTTFKPMRKVKCCDCQ